MGRMQRIESVRECLKMWGWLEEVVVAGIIDLPHDLEMMKECYCKAHEYDWNYNCALCQYVGDVGETTQNNLDCTFCPLLSTWGHGGDEAVYLSCCGEDSPYWIGGECIEGGDLKSALVEIRKIIAGCQKFLKFNKEETV